MGGMGGMGSGRRGTSTRANTFDSNFVEINGGTFVNMGGMPPRTRPATSRTDSFDGRPASPTEKTSEITKPLMVSLEDLYNGTMKHMKVGRKLMDGSTEDKVLDVQILPGWKSGTKVRFANAGNIVPSTGEAQDLVFVVEEKPHEVFKRDGNDLIANVKIPLVEALAGPPSGVSKPVKTVEMLDGRKLQVPVPTGIVKPGQRTTITGEGMPARKGGKATTKGDLIVNWDVVFPGSLSSSQKDGLRKILR